MFAPSIYTPGANSMAPAQQYINPYYQAAQQGVQQQQQSGGGPNLLSTASDGRSVYNSISNGFQMPQSQTLNSFGQSLGFAPAASSTGFMYGGVGPAALPWAQPGMMAPASMAGQSGVMSSAGSLTGSTLSSTLGAAGLGAFAGSFLGKIGGNSTGGSIGGAIGAGIGNMILPGVGGVIGGALGGIAGGFFGNSKPSTKAANTTTYFAEDGSYRETYRDSFKGGSNQVTDHVSSQLGGLTNAASKALGIKFKTDIGFQSGTNTLHSGGPTPYYANVETNSQHDANFNGQRYWLDPEDPKSVDSAYKNLVINAATSSGYTDTKAISDWYDANVKGGQLSTAQGDGSYIVPFKSKERFDDFMNKFKAQDTVNGTNAAPATT